jgi:hypothetical protein
MKTKTPFMKTKILFLPVTVFSLALIFTSCKKENNDATDYSTELSAQSDDQSRFSSETDAVANDADVALETTSYFSARTGQTQSIICDASIAIDTMSNPRTITITYNGTNCLGNRTRTGVVVISMAAGVHWKDAGAAITVTYQNVKITRVSDNKSITINGTHTITNASGGLLINLPTLVTITHTITSSGMSVTFDDNTERTWQVARQRVFSFNNGVVITTTGTHTDGNNTHIAEWGTNRLGHTFATSILEPLVIRQDCNFRLVSGKVEHKLPLVTAVATFGLDASGNPTSCPGAGHYYFEVVWTGTAGNTHTIILPY